MKYLKLFENSKYFSEVRSQIFDTSNVENFTDSELFSIKSLLGNGDYRFQDVDRPSKKFRSKLIIYLSRLGPPKYVIVKLTDEWFYVQVYSSFPPSVYTYYKCDQFEGLIKCLEKSQSI